MRFSLPPIRHPRNPLLRILSLVIGVALVGLMLVFGLAVAGLLLVGGIVLLAVRRLARGQAHVGATKPGDARQPNILEGQFVVVRRDRGITQ